MSIVKKTFGVASAAVLVFSMAACSNDATATESPAAERPTSPLNEIMNEVWGTNLSQEEQQRQFDEQAARREEIIAQCMNEQGFDYVPNPNSGGIVTVIGEDMWRPDDRDWVAQWGYGAMNSPWNAQPEVDVDAPEPDPNQWFDPNQELWDSMSESELQAWQEALWGPPMETLPEGIVEETGDGGWVVIDNDAFNRHRGCNGLAWAETNSDAAWNVMNSDEFRPLMDAMNAMYEDVRNHPEMAVIDREWAACMADAGYPGFTVQQDAQTSIWDAQSALWEDLGDWDWELGSPNASNNPAWAALGEHEIELALADLDCREAVDYRGRQEAVQFAAERQFIADYRAQLDALLAAAQQR